MKPASSTRRSPNELNGRDRQGLRQGRLQPVEAGADPGRQPPDPPDRADPREHPPRPRPVPRRPTARIATADWPVGDGESFVKQDVFNEVVFGGNPSERQARIDALDEKTKALWNLEARRLGQPAPPGQPESRDLQGRPPADRHLLADRQGNQRCPDAGPLSLAVR